MATALNDNNGPLLLPQLPEDALVEILSRLPVESILRFKCVCKSWYALFNSPSFTAKYLQLVKANHHHQYVFLKRYLKDDEGKTKWVTCFFPDDYNFDRDERELVVGDFSYDVSSNDCLSLIGHCDGIVALSLGSDFSDGVILCNPATRQSRTLPNSSFYPIPYGYRNYIDDSFQPVHPDEDGDVQYNVDVFNNFIGFGYDPKTKDYKVIRDVAFWWDETGMVNHKVEVFSIGTDSSWREINGDAIGNTTKPPSGDIHLEQYFDGFCYWGGWSKIDGEMKHFLISFDLADEVFQKMLMPDFGTDLSEADDFDIEFIVPRIGVYNNECIALYVTNQLSDKGRIDLWVMREFGMKDSWTKQLTIVASNTLMYYPVLFWKNAEEFLYVDEQWCLSSYNHHTHESKRLSMDGASFSACRYLKTIVSVNRREEVINRA